METLRSLSKGSLVELSRSALQCLQWGERIAFLEVFSGKMLLTLGVRAMGLKALDGWDRMYPMGDKRWDFATREDRDLAERLVDWVDPVIGHLATPCDKLSQQSLHPGQVGYDEAKV